MSEVPEPMDKRSLLRGSAIAAVLAVVVLLVAILPAEYGIDPTGVGTLIGFTRLAAPGDDPAVQQQDGVEERYGLSAAWRLVETPIAKRTGFLEDGETARFVIPLNVTNLTAVTARLDWSDADTVDGDATRPDLFDVRIVAPDRRDSGYVSATNAPGGDGNITAQVRWQSVPFPQADHPDGVLFPVAPADRSGVGDWTFHVRLLRAGGSGDADQDDPGDDPGNDWRLMVSVEHYALEVRETSGRATDQVLLTLPPGGGLEYKFRMQEGATFDYSWSSGAPLFWDLHAEATGAAADDTTSFARGTSAGESGTHTAPFAGRHGWFWSNEGDEAVTITLETTGTYEIIGVT